MEPLPELPFDPEPPFDPLGLLPDPLPELVPKLLPDMVPPPEPLPELPPEPPLVDIPPDPPPDPPPLGEPFCDEVEFGEELQPPAASGPPTNKPIAIHARKFIEGAS